MTPEGIALLVASVLGSTGLASLIGSGTGFTRAARLRSAIAATKGSIDGLDPESSAYRATQASITVMSLELASYALVRVPMRSRMLVFLFSIAMFILIIQLVASSSLVKILSDPSFNMTPAEFWFSDVDLFLDNQAVSKEYWWAYAVIYIFYIMLLSIVLIMQTAQRRERFVAEALKRNEVDYALIVKHGRQLHEHVSKKKPATTGLGTDFSKIQHFAPPESLKAEKKRAWWQIWTTRGS